ncbi:MAG: polyribonucleotide nucleotidyltransferase [Bacteriovoracia bacterium]
MIHSVSCELGGKKLTIETGKLAKQADGSVLVSYGDTRVLVTACCSQEPKVGIDFFPLTVEFSERFYAAGRIPGSFHRREGRPTSEATLSARLIDRPMRPLFPEGFYCETQIVATILSADLEADIDSAASIGAAAAVHISEIPFNGPTAGCRVGRINGQYVINPTYAQLKSGESDLEIFVNGTSKAIMMVEGGAKEVSEEAALGAILKGHEEIKKVCAIIEELRSKCGKPKRNFVAAQVAADIKTQVEKLGKDGLNKALRTKEKAARYELVDATKKSVVEALVTEEMKKADPVAAEARKTQVKATFELLQYNLMRQMILSDKIRIDGRDTKTIRPITTEVGLLPRAHGSALFTRGETQVLSTVTLGTSEDEQIVDTLQEKGYRQFLFHYNFPPFSVGECGRMGGLSRREIGHGALAERAVKQIAPSFDQFPYTVRVVCETLESNGSSSMGSVCSASMAMMHAGIPMPAPVAGIAMGLIKEGGDFAVLSDILGDEDHLGDMDFKVAGTQKGITSIQMDIKIEGIDEKIMRQALTQAHEGRLHILGKMAESITQPSAEMSMFAPRITTLQIPVDKIGAVIGPSGKVIKGIIAATGCKIDINDDGKINIASNDAAAVKAAIESIQGITAEVEEGKTYKGVVKKVVDFGAFVAILPGQEGLLHISEIAHERVNMVSDHYKEGDEVEVKVIEVDPTGRVRLSRRALLDPPPGGLPPRNDRPPGGGDRGGRGGFGGGRGGDRGGRGGDRGGRGGGDRGPRGGDRGDRGGPPRH